MYEKSISDFRREILFLSSGKAKDFANRVRQTLSDRIQNNDLLRDEYECLAWDNRRLFKKSHTTFDSLLEYAQWLLRSDGYAVCVLYPDDIVLKDGDENSTSYYVPRDNVIFELGLFYGALGKNNTFFLLCDSANNKIIHSPTDLDGVTSFKYYWDNSMNAPTKDAAKDLAVQLCDTIYDHLTNENKNITKEPITNETTKKTPMLQNDINNEAEIKSKENELKELCIKREIQTQSVPNNEVANVKAPTMPLKTSYFPKPLTQGIAPK